MKKETNITNVKLGKLVHGGQALSEMPSGKKILVWGGLPGETINARIIKKKSSYAEGVVTEVVEAVEERITPQEPDSYLSTSPWQIMTFDYENRSKQLILEETFSREKVAVKSYEPFEVGAKDFNYRNKMEFGFWGDDSGLHLAHYVRGTHGKQIVQSSMLAKDCINHVASAFIVHINKFVQHNDLRAGDLKTVLFRCSDDEKVVGALFVKRKDIDFSSLSLPEELQGLNIYYSNPKSPASIPSEELYSFGDINITDKILGVNIKYDVLSFFQVNLPVFEKALKTINSYTEGLPTIDFYSGVGTIGLVVGSETLVEVDPSNVKMAKENSKTATKVIQATSEDAIDHIVEDKILIVDPPRAGLHKKVVEKINEVVPPKLIYLSCNPITQARDIKMLEEKYKIIYAQGFNFFPRTPHIESLVILEKI